MSAAENERELTSTLNLGLRSIQSPGVVSAAENFLQKIDPLIKSMIEKISSSEFNIASITLASSELVIELFNFTAFK